MSTMLESVQLESPDDVIQLASTLGSTTSAPDEMDDAAVVNVFILSSAFIFPCLGKSSIA